MAVDYRLDIRNAAGEMQAQLVGQSGGIRGGFLGLSYTKRVNSPGTLVFSLEGGNASLAASVGHRWIIEVWRRDADNAIAWYRDFIALVKARTWSFSDHETVSIHCEGILSLLSDRYILYYAGTANRSTFSNVKAETIMKTLVSYNAGTNATTGNGRIRAGVIAGLTVETDGAAGKTLSLSCAWDNLLETLQKIAAIGGGDFDLVPDTTPPNYKFRWYTGQLGTDRTASVTYALEHGNMSNVKYSDSYINARSVAIVGGRGEMSARAIEVCTGAGYDSLTNNVEIFVNGSNEATASALQALGDARLNSVGRRQEFEFEALQTPACLYGKHVFLGDLVTARYRDIVTVTRKILQVQVSYSGNGEKVKYEFGSP